MDRFLCCFLNWSMISSLYGLSEPLLNSSKLEICNENTGRHHIKTFKSFSVTEKGKYFPFKCSLHSLSNSRWLELRESKTAGFEKSLYVCTYFREKSVVVHKYFITSTLSHAWDSNAVYVMLFIRHLVFMFWSKQAKKLAWRGKG